MVNESVITNDCIDICKEYKKYHIKFKNKKIIITGGAGFLLSYFCDLVYILNSQYKLNVKLIIYDKFVFGFPARLKKFKGNKNIKFIEKDFSKKFNLLNNKFRIVYTGTLGLKHDCRLLLSLISNFKEIEFLIVASGSGYQQLKSNVRNLKNVKCLPLQPFNQLSKVLGSVSSPSLAYDIERGENYLKTKLDDIKTDVEKYKPRKTQAVERVLNRAFTQVLFAGRNNIDIVDVFISMLSEKKSYAFYVTEQGGINKDK